jgi:hypothetical protein
MLMPIVSGAVEPRAFAEKLDLAGGFRHRFDALVDLPPECFVSCSLRRLKAAV